MSSIDRFAAAFDGLRQGLDSGRLAHAYVIIGSPRGEALALAQSLLQLLFCSAKDKPCGKCITCRQVKDRLHPDIIWLNPESRSRRIVIEQIREDLAPRIVRTSFGGGWKAGVLLHADRMTEEAANAFLKLLEEPPGNSLLLLLTDAPHGLLPTILSRCQRILLAAREEEDDAPWRAPLMELLRGGAPASPIEVSIRAQTVRAILDEEKKRVEAEVEEEAEKAESATGVEEDKDVMSARVAGRVAEARARIMGAILLWQRDVLMAALGEGEEAFHYADDAETIRRQARGRTVTQALADVGVVDEMARRLERNVPPEAVLEAGWR